LGTAIIKRYGELAMHTPTEPIEGQIAPQVEPSQVELVPTEPEVKDEEKVSVEEFSISGDALVSTIKKLIHQGNIRRIIIKNEEGRTLIEIPLTIGVVGGVISAALFPVVAAVGVIGAMVTHLKLVVEKKE
jgi:hypothetical protein